MKESAIRAKILRYLNSLPLSDFWVSPPGSPTALPDICGVLAGRAVYVEVKVPGKKPRKAQRYRMKKLKAAGAVVIVAHSVEEIKNGKNDLFRHGYAWRGWCDGDYDGYINK